MTVLRDGPLTQVFTVFSALFTDHDWSSGIQRIFSKHTNVQTGSLNLDQIRLISADKRCKQKVYLHTSGHEKSSLPPRWSVDMECLFVVNRSVSKSFVMRFRWDSSMTERHSGGWRSYRYDKKLQNCLGYLSSYTFFLYRSAWKKCLTSVRIQGDMKYEVYPHLDRA